MLVPPWRRTELTLIPLEGSPIKRAMRMCEQSQQSQSSLQMPTESREARVSDDWLDGADVDEAIRATLPLIKPGSMAEDHFNHDRAEFNFARALKAIARIADAPSAVLRPLARRWHDRASEVSQKPWEETWLNFSRAWKNVRFAAGTGPLDQAWARARVTDAPPAAMQYEQVGVRLLVSLCRELQSASGSRPFFLSCRKAAALLREKDHMRPWRWMNLLIEDGWLEVSEKHTQKRATRYRYRDVSLLELAGGASVETVAVRERQTAALRRYQDASGLVTITG
jgi:hypothetical protein